MIGKALIPLAGLGTRLRPFTYAAPKAMLPLVDSSLRVRPVIDYIVAEATSAGIQEVGLIVSPGQRELLEKYFTNLAAQGSAAGSASMPRRIEYILQEQPRGFGDAVSLGESFVGDEPFMLLLGDYVYLPDSASPPCAAQVAAAFASLGGAAVIGMQPVGVSELPKVGAARGEPMDERTYRCTDFIEKPSLVEARWRLVTPDLPKNKFLAHCGIYVFSPEIFACLAELKRAGKLTRGEVQLADAQSMLLERHKGGYYLYRIAGQAYDVGTPENYVETFEAFVKNGR